jgi:hypothetical protein
VLVPARHQPQHHAVGIEMQDRECAARARNSRGTGRARSSHPPGSGITSAGDSHTTGTSHDRPARRTTSARAVAAPGLPPISRRGTRSRQPSARCEVAATR